APQPLGLALTLRRSFHPIGLLGHPSAVAIGRQMAITIGERTSGSPGGQSGLLWRADWKRSLRMVTYAPEAGLNTCGLLVPDKMSCTASPEPIACPWIWIALPLDVFGLFDTNEAICSSSQLFFSLP